MKELAEIVMDEMHMRLAVRETVHKIKALSTEISTHIKSTISDIERIPDEKKRSELLRYLEASHTFLQNLEGQLEVN